MLSRIGAAQVPIAIGSDASKADSSNTVGLIIKNKYCKTQLKIDNNGNKRDL